MYYRLNWELSRDPSLRDVEKCPDLGVPWTMGRKFKKSLPELIVCTLGSTGEPTMSDIYLTHIPLFSDHLLSALKAAGIDNFDAYRAELVSPRGKLFPNYFAVNILGLVQCAHMQESQFLPDLPAPLIEFTHLVIDAKRAAGQEFFRLGQNSLYIVISERVAKLLNGQNLVGVGISPIDTV
jgi:hypothetical protein